ncbi:MAG: hypothetical protein EAX86_04835 [Candidatus Heimdallarchaeota archaeon]|nr:hypothetical protein [Candidatus Heimdallarchaeota archaeon]
MRQNIPTHIFVIIANLFSQFSLDPARIIPHCGEFIFTVFLILEDRYLETIPVLAPQLRRSYNISNSVAKWTGRKNTPSLGEDI